MRNHVIDIVQVAAATGVLAGLAFYTLTQPHSVVVLTAPVSLFLLFLLPALLPAFSGSEPLWIMVLSFPARLAPDILLVQSFLWANLSYGEPVVDATMTVILYLLLYSGQLVIIAEIASILWIPSKGK